jgi:hypothetical protein
LRCKADSFEKIYFYFLAQKKNISGQKATSDLTKVLLEEKQFLQKSHYCQKAITAKNPFLAKCLIKFDPLLTDLIQENQK